MSPRSLSENVTPREAPASPKIPPEPDPRGRHGREGEKEGPRAAGREGGRRRADLRRHSARDRVQREAAHAPREAPGRARRGGGRRARELGPQAGERRGPGRGRVPARAQGALPVRHNRALQGHILRGRPGEPGQGGRRRRVRPGPQGRVVVPGPVPGRGLGVARAEAPVARALGQAPPAQAAAAEARHDAAGRRHAAGLARHRRGVGDAPGRGRRDHRGGGRLVHAGGVHARLRQGDAAGREAPRGAPVHLLGQGRRLQVGARRLPDSVRGDDVGPGGPHDIRQQPPRRRAASSATTAPPSFACPPTRSASACGATTS
jgi:hypothetical protein